MDCRGLKRSCLQRLDRQTVDRRLSRSSLAERRRRIAQQCRETAAKA